MPDYIVDNTNPIYIVFGDHTRSFNIATKSFCVMDNVQVLKPKNTYSIQILLYIISAWQKCIPNKGYARHWKIAKTKKFYLPICKNGKIDFDFMDSFIAEMEVERLTELSVYLKVSGLDNYELTNEEKDAIGSFNSLKWRKFNLKNLFGEATRGKRLKSDDRFMGDLPFVTAGETDEGISDFIGNSVEIFSKNTTTIDMFGSAKYRNYEYGCDDHVAIVHTEKLPMNAAIFVTTAIHKSSHNGQFDYGKNFYAKDADELWISLPVKNDKPDYDTMSIIISAVHKIVIKDVVSYSNRKIEAIKDIIV